MIAPVENFDFVFPDIHGDLKLRLKQPDKDGKLLVNFVNTDDIAHLILQNDYDCVDKE